MSPLKHPSIFQNTEFPEPYQLNCVRYSPHQCNYCIENEKHNVTSEMNGCSHCYKRIHWTWFRCLTRMMPTGSLVMLNWEKTLEQNQDMLKRLCLFSDMIMPCFPQRSARQYNQAVLVNMSISCQYGSKISEDCSQHLVEGPELSVFSEAGEVF